MTLPLLVLPLLMIQTPSAPAEKVQIKETLIGQGKVAQIGDIKGDIVTVDYTGKLKDGTVFDSTKGMKPFTFILGAGQVIKGWDTGVVGMREGGTRELTIPPSLAYGNKTVSVIPANSTLNFSITLLRIEPPVQETILVKGSGPKAKFNDLVYIQLAGKPQGAGANLWDTSDLKQGDGKPIPIMIGEPKLPIGLTWGLIGMQEGEKRRLVIPPSIAYGAKGVPPSDRINNAGVVVVKSGSIIPPNSTMEFEIQLVKLQPKKPPAPSK